jgi:hypothetical protein
MMKLVAGTALAALFLALPAPVFALGMETHGNAPVGAQPGWAQGVVGVVNLRSRVYSMWVNGNENFYYRGDARALNEALEKFAAVKDEVRQVILLPGSGRTQTFRGQPVDFDWQLHVPSGIYRAVSKRTHAVLTVYINAPRPRPLPRRTRQRIAVWLGELDSTSFATRDKAHKELQKLGPDAKPLLRRALRARPELEARRRIEGLLAKLRALDVTDLEIPKGITIITTDDLLAVHLKGLKAADATVCAMAMHDLSPQAPYSDKVVPALTGMLKEGKPEYVRLVAVGCLARIGAPARSALPALKDGLKDPSARVRQAFQTAVDQLQNAKDDAGRADEVKRRHAILKDIRDFQKAAGNKP